MHREGQTHTHFAGGRNAGHPNTKRGTFSPHLASKRSARNLMDSMAVSHHRQGDHGDDSGGSEAAVHASRASGEPRRSVVARFLGDPKYLPRLLIL